MNVKCLSETEGFRQAYKGHTSLFPVPFPHAFGNFQISIFSILSAYCMHEVMRKYLMTKISIQRESNWFISIAMMLIYRLLLPGPETEVQLGVE